MHETANDGDKKDNGKIERISIERAENGFIYHAMSEGSDGMGEDNHYVYENVDDVLAAVKDDLETPHLRGSKPPLGSGERFKELEGKLASKGANNPAALAAFIGRKKFGAAKFNALAAAGRRRLFK